MRNPGTGFQKMQALNARISGTHGQIERNFLLHRKTTDGDAAALDSAGQAS
jgi:hypothetical protein